MTRRTLIIISVLVAVALVFVFSLVRSTAAYNLKASAEEILGLEFTVAAEEMCLESAREETRVHSWKTSVHSQTFHPTDGYVVVIKVADKVEEDNVGEPEDFMNPLPRNRPTEYFRCVFSTDPQLKTVTQVRG